MNPTSWPQATLTSRLIRASLLQSQHLSRLPRYPTRYCLWIPLIHNSSGQMQPLATLMGLPPRRTTLRNRNRRCIHIKRHTGRRRPHNGICLVPTVAPALMGVTQKYTCIYTGTTAVHTSQSDPIADIPTTTDPSYAQRCPFMATSKKRAAVTKIIPKERDLPPFHSAAPSEVSDPALEDPLLAARIPMAVR